ncbi:MAG: type II toxin-antitoxin system HipA family toxin [Acidimicrobiales bacterium]
MTYRPTDVIEVHAWGSLVGAVALDPGTGVYAFEYAPEWVDRGIELAPLHMPLARRPYEFGDLARPTFYGLPALLADALPDAFGNALVNAWMAEQGVAAGDITPLDRLAYAADRAMGALEFRPPARAEADPIPSAVQLADLVVAARRTVRGEFGDADGANGALQQLIRVGTSAGGARAKAVVAFNPATYQVRSAYDRPDQGFEQWIIKLDGVSGTGMDGHGDRLGDSAPYGRIEYAYHLMARAAGIDMTECRLLDEGPRRHFMTRRFDRGPGGERVHMVSLCALAHLDYNMVAAHSYDQFLATVTALGLDHLELAEAFRRMAFNVAAVNNDDHTKNVAFLRRAGGPWELAPAYDLTHAYRPDSAWTAQHLMAVDGRFSGIGLSDLHAVGERHHVPAYRRIVREVLGAVDGWPQFAEEAGVDPATAGAVTQDMAAQRPR